MEFAFMVVGMLVGGLIGWNLSNSSNTTALKLAFANLQLARKEAGKLSRIIHKQRLAMRTLKDRLKAVAINAAVTSSKPANRPNLPH